MHVNCPHCQNPIEVVESADVRDLTCPSCGSMVSIAELATRTAKAPEPPLARVGKFELVEPLGEGAFGTVWRATDPDMGRDVAVKLPRAGVIGSKGDEERFLREARAAGSLKHEGIVTVHEVGRQDGTLYIISDFVHGVNLAEWLSGRRPDFREAAELMVQIADALGHAHREGVVHRDMKPSNIMLRLDATGNITKLSTLRPIIMDFGLAKREAREITITREGGHLGTPAYMSPEQARGESHQADARSDVWSLGVMFYELLGGERPFRGQERMLLLQILQDEPKPPRRLNDQIPRDLETITLKCMAKEPPRRYGSAGELAEDLRRYLNGEPILARPVGNAERLWRWAKRKPAAAATAAILLASLTAGLALVAQHNRQLAAEKLKTDAVNLELVESNQKLEQSNEQERAARLEADEQRASAVRSADEARAVLTFFQDKVLAVARPEKEEGGLGINVTIREAIDAAEPQIADSFPDQPLVEASIRNSLGLTYDYLGLAELAIRQHERARDLRENKLGPEHPDTLTSMNNLGNGYWAAGKLDRALPLWERTLELRKAELGPEHPDTLESMASVAVGYKYAGKLDLALPLYEQTLELMKAKLGPEHPDTLISMNNLAMGYYAAGKLDQALPLWEQTLELRKGKLGPEHPDTLRSMNYLGNGYRAAGKLDQALPLMEETLELRKAKLGPEHPRTLTSMYNLALGYYDAGKLDQALPLMEQTLELEKAKLGPEHPNTLTSMAGLAEGYRAAGKLDQALPLLEQTLELLKAKLGPEHPKTLATMNNLALGYSAAGKLDQALPLMEQTLELKKAKLGPEHPDTLTTMENLATAFLAAGQPENALPLFEQSIGSRRKRGMPDDPAFAGRLAAVSLPLLQHRQHATEETYLRECLMIREKKLPDDWVLFNTKSMLGGALAGQKRFQEAEPLLVEGYEGMKEREAKIPPVGKTRLPEAIRRLVDLYTAWGKPEDAEKWQAVMDAATPNEKE